MRDYGLVDPIVLDRRLRVWGYAVVHSQLVLHARADAADFEYLNVLFEDVSRCQAALVVPAADPRQHATRYATTSWPSPKYRNDIGIGT
jgi:hypothetical protein